MILNNLKVLFISYFYLRFWNILKLLFIKNLLNLKMLFILNFYLNKILNNLRTKMIF